MQPENPNPQPPVLSPPPTVEPKRGFFHTKAGKITIVAIVLVVLVGIAALLTASLKSDKSSGTSTDTTSLYVNRNGYNRQQLSKGTADPEALVMTPAKSPIAYGGTPVIQACNVLSIDAIHQIGMHLKANPLAVVVDHTYFDGQGKGKIEPDPYSLPLDDETNTCNYSLQNNFSLSLSVYQPTYVSNAAITYEIGRVYKQTPSINGAEVYTRQSDKDIRYYIIHTHNTYAQVSLLSSLAGKDSVDPDQFMKQALAKIVDNLNKEAANPAGIPKVTFDSPVFKKSYANGCDLVTADDFKAINDDEASPLVRQKDGSGVGVISYRSVSSDQNSYTYIDNACERNGILKGIGGDATGHISINQTHLFITATSYADDKAAVHSYAFTKSESKNVSSATSTKIGDEAMFGDRSDQKKALTFRQGRFVFSLSTVGPIDTPKISDGDLVKKLTPVAQRIAGKLQKME